MFVYTELIPNLRHSEGSLLIESIKAQREVPIARASLSRRGRRTAINHTRHQRIRLIKSTTKYPIIKASWCTNRLVQVIFDPIRMFSDFLDHLICCSSYELFRCYICWFGVSLIELEVLLHFPSLSIFVFWKILSIAVYARLGQREHNLPA